MSDFAGRVAIMTGAATGIGESIVRTSYENAALLVVVGHDGAGLEALLRDLDPDGARSKALAADVRDSEAMLEDVSLAIDGFGDLDMAVNNVGITGPHDTRIEEMSLEDWNEVISIDLTGMLLSLKAELPAKVRRGGGSILNLSSANGIVGVAGIAAYTTAKHGVVGLTKAAALEYADKNIRVNCIGPGHVAMPRMMEMPREALEFMAQSHPLGRLATREEVRTWRPSCCRTTPPSARAPSIRSTAVTRRDRQLPVCQALDTPGTSETPLC